MKWNAVYTTVPLGFTQDIIDRDSLPVSSNISYYSTRVISHKIGTQSGEEKLNDYKVVVCGKALQLSNYAWVTSWSLMSETTDVRYRYGWKIGQLIVSICPHHVELCHLCVLS